MKKFIVLLVALVALFVGTAQADGVSDYYSTSESIVVVTATSAGRGALTASADGTYLHSASYTGLTMSTEDNASYLVFYPADTENGYYYIYSVAAAKVINGTGGALTDGVDDSTDPLMFYIGSPTTGYGYDDYYAIWESTGLRYNLGGSYQTTIETWGTSSGWSEEDDAGNSFTFAIVDDDVETSDVASNIETILSNIAAAQEEEAEDSTKITDLSSLANTTIVKLQFSRDESYLTYSDGIITHTSTEDTESTSQQFVLYTTDDIDGYYLYSVAAGKFFTASGLTSTPSALTFGTDGTSTTYPWRLYDSSGNYLNLANWQGYEAGINSWSTVDGGNSFTMWIEETDNSEVEAAIEELLNVEYTYVTDASELGASVTVIMQSARGIVASELGSTLITSESDIDTDGYQQKFVFYPTDDGYYIYSVNNAAFVTNYYINDVDISLDATTFTLLSSSDQGASDSDTYPWIVQTTEDGTNYWMNNNNNGNVHVDDWTDVDTGNPHCFIVVDTETDYTDAIEALLTETKKGAQVRVEDFLSNSMLIKMQADRSYGGYLTYDENYTYSLTAAEDEADDDSQTFVLYTTDDIDGYYLYSVAAGKFVISNSDEYAELSEEPEVWTLEQDGYSTPTQSWRLSSALYSSWGSSYPNYLTAQNDTGYALQAVWWYADEGNSYKIIIENVADDEIEETIYTLLENNWLTEHPAIMTLDELDALDEGTTVYLKGELAGYIYAGESGLTASTSTAYTTPEGTDYEFSVIKHDDGEYFLYSVAQDALLEADLAPNNAAVALFKIGTPTSFTSYYEASDNADTDSYPFWIVNSDESENINYNSSEGVVMTWWPVTDTGNCYVFHVANTIDEEPVVYDVEIGEVGWRTLALPKTVVAQTAVNVWSGDASQSVDDDNITEFAFGIVEDAVIGAGVGVVLQDAALDSDDEESTYEGGTYYYPYLPSAEATIESNGMTGTADESVTFSEAGEAYVLRKASADDVENGYDLGLGVVFSEVSAGEELGQYKAYVAAPADGSSIAFSFGGTLVEGITTVAATGKAAAQDGVYYDLQGRVVKNPSKGGIYIVDGQKIVK